MAVDGMTADGAKRLDTGTVRRVIFDYGMFNRYSLRAEVTNISAGGADLDVRKTVGPMNYTGSRREGRLKLDAARTAELLEILGRYDIAGMSRLIKGANSSVSRSLNVFDGEQWYDILSNTEFPVTFPPVGDVMFFELYAFFERRIGCEPGWEEVLSEGPADPREDPAYGERRIRHFGNTVRLVPGTGAGREDGRGARIDYGTKRWWSEEGFTGTWIMTEQDREMSGRSRDNASLTVDGGGNVLLKLDDAEWKGRLGAVRYYREEIALSLENGGESRPFSIWNVGENSYAELLVRSFPGPAPMPQFPPTHIRLSDPERKAREEAARVGEARARLKVKADGSWVCDECGAVNTGDYCANCGKILPGCVPGTLRGRGSLSEVLWSSSRSGMMAGDFSRSSMKLCRENGELRLTHTEMPAFQPEVIRIYRADEGVLERLRELSEREGMAGWSSPGADPAGGMFVPDVSVNEKLSLIFDDLPGGRGCPSVLTIDRGAAVKNGGEKAWNEVYRLLRECVRPEALIETGRAPNPYAPGAGCAGERAAECGVSADGTWTCPACGRTGNDMKYCPECGTRRPD